LRILARLYLLALSTICFAQKDTNQFIVGDSIKGVDIIHTLDNGKSSSYKGDKGASFSSGQIIATGPDGLTRLLDKETNSEIRLGSNTVLQWKSNNDFQLFEGSILFCKQNENDLLISSVSGSAEIIGKCSFIAESTSNGGYKFICLSGKPILKTSSGETKIPAGRLVLVLGETNALGNAYDIDLLLLLKSSLLINAFEEPPATMKKIGLAVYSQQLKLKNKYNALIGDAPTDKNLQMWVLGNSGQEKESE
jgi:hypothetical protein